MTSTQPQQVDVTDLNVPQLLDVRKQLELELKQFTAMFGQLKLAQTRFQGCLESVDKIRPENQDKVSLLPLTASLYVPGRLSDPNTVIVDVGTGYFVEKVRIASDTDTRRGPETLPGQDRLRHKEHGAAPGYDPPQAG